MGILKFRGLSLMVTEVTDQNFENEVLKSDLPVLVDLWAPWCGPCRMVGPVVENLSEKNSGKFKFCKLNVDENPQTAAKYMVMAIPTLLFFILIRRLRLYLRGSRAGGFVLSVTGIIT